MVSSFSLPHTASIAGHTSLHLGRTAYCWCFVHLVRVNIFVYKKTLVVGVLVVVGGGDGGDGGGGGRGGVDIVL